MYLAGLENWNIERKKTEEKIVTVQAKIESWTSSSTVCNVTSMPTGAQCCYRGLKVPYKWKMRCCTMLVRFALQNGRCGCLAWDSWIAVCMRGKQINSQCCEGTFYCRANGHHTCTQNQHQPPAHHFWSFVVNTLTYSLIFCYKHALTCIASIFWDMAKCKNISSILHYLWMDQNLGNWLKF